MPWLESASTILPPWLVNVIAKAGSLRASPKLLVGVCGAQFVVLSIGLLQQFNRIECSVAVKGGEPVVVACDTCRRNGITGRSLLLHAGGAAVIGCGLLAVQRRDSRLLYVYGTVMLFFSMVIGMTAMLTALEAPMLEIAVAGVSELDESCVQLAEEMLSSARDHTSLASLGCIVDMAGAVFAIRSKELFSYEEIASQHAEVSNAQAL